MSRHTFRRGNRSIRGPALGLAMVLVAAMGMHCDQNNRKRGRRVGCQGYVCVNADTTVGQPVGGLMPVTVTPQIVVSGGEVTAHRTTIWVDSDDDGNVDVDEDTNGNGVLDPGEDVDGDGKLDTAEPVVQESSTPPPTNPGPTGVPPGTPGIETPINVTAPGQDKTVVIKVRVDVDVMDPGDDTPHPGESVIGTATATQR